jgi:hypothetical protein
MARLPLDIEFRAEAREDRGERLAVMARGDAGEGHRPVAQFGLLGSEEADIADGRAARHLSGLGLDQRPQPLLRDFLPHYVVPVPSGEPLA